MTTLTIGRFSMSDGPTSIYHDGDIMDLELQIDAATTTSPTVAKIKRQQLLGLADNQDEPVVPLTFDDDSTLDGFYSVSSVQCEPFTMFLNNGTMRASIGLRRVTNGYQNPIIETYVVSRLATNSHSVISTTDYAMAAAYRDIEETNLVDVNGLPTLGTTENITMIDGTTLVTRQFADTNVSGYWSRFGTPSIYYSPPSCKIEYLVSGTWYEAVGRQIPNGVAWRISNGVVRIGTIATLPEFNFTIEVADSSAWVGREVVGETAIGGQAGPFIIRNSPETCTVRVMASAGRYVTYSVWRGGTIATISTSRPSAVGEFMETITSEAGTNITGGIRATATDANGNRLVFLTRSTATTSTSAPFSLTSAAATTSSLGVGFNLGATASGLFSVAGMLGQLCTPPQWSQRVAAR